MGPRGYEVPDSVGFVFHGYKFLKPQGIKLIYLKHRFAPGANFSVQDSMVRQFPRVCLMALSGYVQPNYANVAREGLLGSILQRILPRPHGGYQPNDWIHL